MYIQLGNLQDINIMSMKDFNNLHKYLKMKKMMNDGQPIPLKQSQKDMIKRAQERMKHG